MKTWWACDLHEKGKAYHSCDHSPVCEEVIRKADAEEEIEKEKVESFNKGWEIGRTEGPGTAEIEKARREAQEGASAWMLDIQSQARADERERIASVLRQWIHDNSHKPDWIEGLSDALKIVLHQDADYRKEPWYRPVQEPKPLEKLPDEASRHDQRRLLNELVDAVQGIQKWIVRHDT